MPEQKNTVLEQGIGFGNAADVLFLHAQTGLHPGTGTNLGVVDLPVQRERHTQWPVIAAASIKGVLREACRRYVQAENYSQVDLDPLIMTVFGPPTAEADKHAGALAVTDARILAFPVRSLCGVFAWITCPSLLDRFNRDLRLVGLPTMGPVPRPEPEQAVCVAKSPVLVGGSQKIVLEEFEFTGVEGAEALAAAMARYSISVDDEATRQRLSRHLVVLTDDDFTYFVRHATEIVARVGLDYKRKTVKKGALFFQEFLPTETLFYVLVIANSSRRLGVEHNGSEVLDFLRNSLPPVLQVGGDETIGKGICRVKVGCGEGAAV